MENELKPCPFCGYKNIRLSHFSDKCICNNCNATAEKGWWQIRQHEKIKSLPELAEEKGYWIDTHTNSNLFKVITLHRYEQVVGFQKIHTREFRYKTHSECEAKARAYLEGLK